MKLEWIRLAKRNGPGTHGPAFFYHLNSSSTADRALRILFSSSAIDNFRHSIRCLALHEVRYSHSTSNTVKS